MKNKKQNSVEWLAQAIYDKMKMRGDGKVFQGILEQAKQMHKEEIVDALEAGYQIANEDVKFKHIHTAEQYYNETFGGEK